MITIVYCHPYPGSFNHEILNQVTRTFADQGKEYDVIDLYADGFNPVMERSDLALYSKGRTNDPLVQRYQKALQQADALVYIFPIWWGIMPAMLKGFFDKVFLKGIIYDTTPEGALMPCLDINKTLMVTTSQGPTASFESFFAGYLTPMVFNTVGMNGVTWLNCDETSTGTDAHRKQFIDGVLEKVARL